MKVYGYLNVRPVSGIEREFRQTLNKNHDESELLGIRTSLEGMGWIPLAVAIKDGTSLKVSAEKQGTRYEAHLNLSPKIPPGTHGTCEIRGSPLASVGTFVSVNQESPGPLPFKVLFVCHSSSGDGKSLLKWWIGVNEFLDVDSLPAED